LVVPEKSFQFFKKLAICVLLEVQLSKNFPRTFQELSKNLAGTWQELGRNLAGTWQELGKNFSKG
jgi:hypothetical protein